MTVKKLKELLEKIPDDYDVYLLRKNRALEETRLVVDVEVKNLEGWKIVIRTK